MASSAYLVELDERRRRLLADLIHHLGITSGSAEHEVALSFGLNSLSNHDQMDAEKKKVSTSISTAELLLRVRLDRTAFCLGTSINWYIAASRHWSGKHGKC